MVQVFFNKILPILKIREEKAEITICHLMKKKNAEINMNY